MLPGRTACIKLLTVITSTCSLPVRVPTHTVCIMTLLNLSRTRIWKNTLVYPAGVALASALVLALQLVARATPMRRLLAKLPKSDAGRANADDIEATGSDGQPLSRVAKLGGPIIYGFKVVRFLSSLTLLGLSIATLIINDRNDDFEYSFDSRWAELGFIGTYVCLPPQRFGPFWLTRYLTGLRIPSGIRVSGFESSSEQACLETSGNRIPCCMGCICVPRPLAARDFHSPASRCVRRVPSVGKGRRADLCRCRDSSCDAATVRSRRS